MYNFKSLIKKYGKVKPLKKTVTGGFYDYDNGGIWVEGGVDWTEFEGAVAPIDQNLIKDSLDYTVDDKKLYTYEGLEPGQKVKHKDVEYTLMSFKDYSDFDESLQIFVMKRGGQ